MKALRAPSTSRFFLIAVMMMSWFALTNHCALGGIWQAAADGADEVPACHAGAPATEDEAPCPEMQQCCKVMKAALSDQVSVPEETGWLAVVYGEAVAGGDGLLRPERFSACAHAPPQVRSFAELVLQRSLHSHAPPVG